MIKFYDIKHKKLIELNKPFIVESYRALSSGATLPIKAIDKDWVTVEPEIQNVIGLRNLRQNTLLGAVLTKPNKSSFLLEAVFEDLKDNYQHDGDIAYFEETNPDCFSFERLTPREVKKRFPAWHPYHHQDKNYLK